MSLINQNTHAHLLVPRGNLGRFVLEQAERTSRDHGVTYVPSTDAPSAYPDLIIAYRKCVATSKPFPVSPAHCRRTIYTRPQLNWVFRFVHDIQHVTRSLTFTTADELEMGMYHLEALRAAGYRPETYEHQLLHADTIGQTYCQAFIGRFPYDQRQFAYDCLDFGVEAAIELEARRMDPSP